MRHTCPMFEPHGLHYLEHQLTPLFFPWRIRGPEVLVSGSGTVPFKGARGQSNLPEMTFSIQVDLPDKCINASSALPV